MNHTCKIIDLLYLNRIKLEDSPNEVVDVEKLKPILADEAEPLAVPKLEIEKGEADEAAVVV